MHSTFVITREMKNENSTIFIYNRVLYLTTFPLDYTTYIRESFFKLQFRIIVWQEYYEGQVIRIYKHLLVY